MSNCQSCASNEGCAGACPSAENQPSEAQAHSHIKHIIVVMSGKGGVGKSSFSALLALSLKRKGHQVGIFDADITGPSQAKLFGFKSMGGLFVGEHGPEPMQTAEGLRLLSMNMLLPEDDDPVVWRGVMLSNVIKQFMEEICWNELDYLVVDMPPGTGDVALTVLQSFKIDGAVIVTTPQSLSNMIVRKGVKMLELMDIEPFAIAENMSHIVCPDCGKKMHIFGDSHVAETAEKHNIPLLGQFPLDPELAECADRGDIESYNGPVRALMDEKIDLIIRAAEAKW